MKGITFVQAFQYWLKLVAIAVPALILLMVVQHPTLTSADPLATPTFHHTTRVEFPSAETIDVRHPVVVAVHGTVDGVGQTGALDLRPGSYQIGARTSLVLPVRRRRCRP